MKRGKEDFSLMLRDYEYVKRVIENPDNRYKDVNPIHNLIVYFRKKWNDIKWKEYLYDLRDRWMALDERTFEEKLKKQKV